MIDAPDTSDTNLYVQSAELNGVPMQRAWLTHAEILSGGTLTLHMGPRPSRWASERILPSVLTVR